MSALSSADILRLWETAAYQAPLDRALSILAAACPETPREELARLSIGDRDARLLAVRARTFGGAARGVVRCEGCGERVEFPLDLQALRVERPGPAAGEVEADGWRLGFRAPTSEDLALALREDDPWSALASRCVTDARRDGHTVVDPDLPRHALALLSAVIAERDPQAEILLEYECPACRRLGRTLFDVAAFLWDEIEAQAKRLLREVAALARAYGWREADVLAMSPARRRAYLELMP